VAGVEGEVLSGRGVVVVERGERFLLFIFFFA